MKFKMIMPLLLALLIFIISFSCYIIKKQEKDTTLFPPVDGFTIKIDVPKTDYELLKQEIDHFIQTQENEFLKKIDITSNSKTIFDEKVGYDEDLMKIFEATSLSDLIQKLDELTPAIDIEDSSKSIRIQDLLAEFGDGSVDEKRVLDIITKYEEYNMNKTSQCPRQITINL